MRILAVDEGKRTLESLTEAIAGAAPAATVHAFREASAAAEQFARTPYDVAFLQLRDGDGAELARTLQGISSRVNIIFLADGPEYAAEAFRLHASDYLLKPVTPDGIRDALEHLRYPLPSPRTESGISIRCFGTFEVYSGTDVLSFRRTKSKELLAYLVNRLGAVCTMGEIMSVLWETGPDSPSRSSNLRNVISDLKRSLREAGAEHILIKNRNTIRLDCGAVHCDYFEYLKNNAREPAAYSGEFMAQYSWAEITLGNLTSFPW